MDQTEKTDSIQNKENSDDVLKGEDTEMKEEESRGNRNTARKEEESNANEFQGENGGKDKSSMLEEEDADFLANFNSQEVLQVFSNKGKPNSAQKHESEEVFDCSDLSYILDNPEKYLQKRERNTKGGETVCLSGGRGGPVTKKEEGEDGKRSVNNKHTILNKLHSMWEDDDDSSIRTATEQATRKTSESEENDDFLMPKGLDNITIGQRKAKKTKKEDEESEQEPKNGKSQIGENASQASEEGLSKLNDKIMRSLGERNQEQNDIGGSFGFTTFTTGGQKKSLEVNEDKMQKALSLFNDDEGRPLEPAKKKVNSSSFGSAATPSFGFGFASAGKSKDLGIKEETLNRFKKMFEDEESSDDFELVIPKRKQPPKPFKPPFKKLEDEKENSKNAEKNKGSSEETKMTEEKTQKKPEEKGIKKPLEQIEENSKGKEAKAIQENPKSIGEKSPDKQTKKTTGFGSSFGFSKGGGTGKMIGINPKTMDRIKKLFSDDEGDDDGGFGATGFSGFSGFKAPGFPKTNQEESKEEHDVGLGKKEDQKESSKGTSASFGFGFSAGGGMKKIELNESSLAKAQKLFDFGDSQSGNGLGQETRDGASQDFESPSGCGFSSGFGEQRTNKSTARTRESPLSKVKEENIESPVITKGDNNSQEAKELSMIEETGGDSLRNGNSQNSVELKKVKKQKRTRGQFNFSVVNGKNEESGEEEYYDVFGGIQVKKKVSENRQENTNMQIEEDRRKKKQSSGTTPRLRPDPPSSCSEARKPKEEGSGTKKIKQSGFKFKSNEKQSTKMSEEPPRPKRETIGLALPQIYSLFPKIEKMNEIRSQNKKKDAQRDRSSFWMARHKVNLDWKEKLLDFPWKKAKEEIKLACWCDVNLPMSYSQYFQNHNDSPQKDPLQERNSQSKEKEKEKNSQSKAGEMTAMETEEKSKNEKEDEMELKRKKVLFEHCRCNDQFLISPEDLFEFFLYLGFDDKNATREWFMHHLGKICFKFQCSRIVFENPPGSKVLNAKNVLGELIYRYYVEFEAGQRSVIRQVLEGDENPTRFMVLQVHDVILEQDKTTLELSDGWYSLWAEISRPKTKEGNVLPFKMGVPGFNDGNLSQLCSLVDRQKIFIGRKLKMAGCGFWNKSKAPAGDNAVEGNPIKSKRFVDLGFNCICPAHPSDKLGAQPGNSMVKSLQSIRPYGGMVCGAAFYVIKKSLFMERFLWEDSKEGGVKEVIRPFELPDGEDPNVMVPQEKSQYTFFGLTVADPKSLETTNCEIYFMNYSRDDVYEAIGEGDFLVMSMLRTSFFVKSLIYPRNSNSYNFDKGKEYANHMRLFADVRLSQLKFHRKASLLKNNWHLAQITPAKERMFIQNFVASDYFRKFTDWKHFIYLNQISGYFRLDSDDGKILTGSGINCTISISKVATSDLLILNLPKNEIEELCVFPKGFSVPFIVS